MGLKENTYFNKFKWSRKKHYVTRGTGREDVPYSYHPPGEVAPGEAFVKRLYEALRGNKELWEKTLLIITFDEHGGT